MKVGEAVCKLKIDTNNLREEKKRKNKQEHKHKYQKNKKNKKNKKKHQHILQKQQKTQKQTSKCVGRSLISEPPKISPKKAPKRSENHL